MSTKPGAGHSDDILNKRVSLHKARVENVLGLLRGFFSVAPENISTARALADELAGRTRLLRDFLSDELTRQEQEHEGARLYGLYLAFKRQVSESITIAEFSDAFAQTLSYGLFLSKLNANGHSLRLDNARQFVPRAFRLIQELVGFLDELEGHEYRDVKWVIDQILSVTNGVNVPALKNDLSFRNRKRSSAALTAKNEEEWRLFSRDPFVYFYEYFLARYDAELRRKRGVYYTPPPVVNFIIRGIDDILKQDFQLPFGMADSRVTALEFACGTGTFVVEMMQRAIENIGSSSAKIDLMLREHILRNVYAFEYLIAPYTIAHLKVSQYLEERQIRISEDERFNIYLTNTLEPIDPQPDYFVPALSDETKRATKVKKKPILVITGNPPYAGESKNKGPWITHAIEEYKFLTFHDESGLLTRAPVREKNLKWLHDDYVKFIRFAQMKMDATSEGVVGVITNHSYLDNPTFAGMRNSLMQTFDQIWIVDFHGSIKPKELAPDGMSDENVFDIQKGVAVAFFVKKAGTLKGVWRTDVWGERIEKYKFAASARVGELSWTKLNPQFPDYIFIVQDRGLQAEYERGVFVTDILVQHSVGIVTARDSLAIHFDRETLLETVKRFAALPVEEARKRFKLRKDVRDWKVEWAQADLISHGPNPEGATQILYRPFDVRWTYYTGDSRGFHCYPRHDVMRHLLKDNIALITSRMTKGEQFAHVQVTDKPAEVICMSPETSNNGFVFPLYLYAPPAGETLSLPDLFGNGNPFAGRDRIENVAPKFRAWLNSRYDKIFTVEEIFGFVYAILHCRIYRKRYGEFMRRSFPRIPFPTARDDFEKLSKLGWDLAQWHLFKGDFDRKLGGYHGSGNNKVERVRYSENNQSIYINDDQRFANVPRDVWEYYVGGYQVLDRFLRYRQNRQLSLAEISNVELTVNILASSLEQMDRIDEVYRAGF